MRLRLPIKRSLLLASMLAFALIALLPLRLAVGWFGFGERGLSARAATGSVWTGVLNEARFGPAALGDVSARLHLLPLLAGRARLALAGTDPQAPFDGAVTASRHGFGVDDVTGRFRIGGLATALPIAAIELRDVSAAFARGRCVRAEGRVTAAAAGALAGLAPAFAGNARCDGDALLVRLAGGSGMERIDLGLFADGRYRVDLMVRTGDPAVRDRLLAAGLRPAAGGYAMRIAGAF